MIKKKGKKKESIRELTPEVASVVEALREEIKHHEERSDPLEVSLQEIRSHLGTSLETDLAIVDALGSLPTPRMARLLQSLLKSFSDKRVLKAIRRSLYRIGQRGIPIGPEGEGKEGTTILRPPLRAQTKGFMSAIDFEGSQAVLLTIPRRPKGLHLLQGIVSDTRGLLECDQVETTSRGFREFCESMTQSGQFPIVEVNPGYCRFLLDQAAQLLERHGKVPPAAYLASKKDLEEIESAEKPPIDRFFDEGGIQKDTALLKKSSELFQIEPFSSWFLPREEIQTYVDLIEEAEQSRLVLNPVQKEERLQEVYRRALTELFPEDRREIYRRRLEAMAYVLLKEGEEESAKAALAAGIALRKAQSALEPHPFLLGLVVRSIYAIVAEEREKRREEPSLIVRP